MCAPKSTASRGYGRRHDRHRGDGAARRSRTCVARGGGPDRYSGVRISWNPRVKTPSVLRRGADQRSQGPISRRGPSGVRPQHLSAGSSIGRLGLGRLRTRRPLEDRQVLGGRNIRRRPSRRRLCPVSPRPGDERRDRERSSPVGRNRIRRGDDGPQQSDRSIGSPVPAPGLPSVCHQRIHRLAGGPKWLYEPRHDSSRRAMSRS